MTQMADIDNVMAGLRKWYRERKLSNQSSRRALLDFASSNLNQFGLRLDDKMADVDNTMAVLREWYRERKLVNDYLSKSNIYFFDIRRF